jgi:selenocysteine lyase/cysteine desulfurase
MVADAMRKWVNETESSAYLIGHRYGDLDLIRASCAKFINAEKDEIALLKNTAEGISIVARGIDFKKGDRIVSAAGEYPANIYPWMDAAKRHELQLILVPETTGPSGERFVPLQAILDEAAKPNTRVVALSHVEFATGQRHDLATIGRFCRERGILFCVDAIQSLGALPVDVKTMSIDYLASGGQKWMLGPEGSALFYCRKDLIELTPPLVVGAINVINNTAFGHYDFTLQSTAGRFESGTYSMVGLAGMWATIEFLHSFGADAIAHRIKHLTDRLTAGLREKGYTIAGPREDAQWSGIVSFSSAKHDHAAITRTLRKDHKIEVVVREGRLRVSPHFYMTDEQIDRLIERLP